MRFIRGCRLIVEREFLDNAPVIEYLLKDYGKQNREPLSIVEFKDEQYNKLAAHVRQYVDIDRIYQILTDD